MARLRPVFLKLADTDGPEEPLVRISVGDAGEEVCGLILILIDFKKKIKKTQFLM
jgi:hypothetical protein